MGVASYSMCVELKGRYNIESSNPHPSAACSWRRQHTHTETDWRASLCSFYYMVQVSVGLGLHGNISFTGYEVSKISVIICLVHVNHNVQG